MYLMQSIIYPTEKLFQPLAVQNIKARWRVFVIDAEFIKKRNEQVVCSLKKARKGIETQRQIIW
jgi:hypothetical protein